MKKAHMVSMSFDSKKITSTMNLSTSEIGSLKAWAKGLAGGVVSFNTDGSSDDSDILIYIDPRNVSINVDITVSYDELHKLIQVAYGIAKARGYHQARLEVQAVMVREPNEDGIRPLSRMRVSYDPRMNRVAA